MIIGKKKLFILFTFILMIILISNILAVNVKSYKPKYGLTTSSVNFRSSTDLGTSSIIRQISKNVNIKMVGEISNFYIVQLNSNEIGFISKDYVKIVSTVPNAKVYQSLTPYNATVINNTVNVRRGPSTGFTKVTSLGKGTAITVIGKIDNFYTVIYSNNKVGMIEGSLIKKETTTGNTIETNTTTTLSNADLVLKYINDARKANGLIALTKDWKLADIALRKSNEMVEKNYFLHTSPTYGTPFDMMKNFGITYKTAGENIAGNSNMKSAVDSWMNSEGHRKNILSNSYNYIGIGVTKSDKYGYIISAMFIGK
ncbi:MAG: CAP domain-containing protein [Clostridia bacterium]|nr:CAP domain-containing protein [Clostridia bacterium]MDD4386791.1 CAP domain-containing protein [Clostridia bacterium]